MNLIEQNSKVQIGKLQYWNYLFCWLLLDSMVTYFGRSFGTIQVNALLPFLVIGVFITKKTFCKLPPTRELLFFCMVCVGLLLGIITGGADSFRIFASCIKVSCAFLIGYNCFANGVNEKWASQVSIVGAIYVFVCLFAISGIVGSLFPIIYSEGYNNGKLIRRAEITTDQNYQVFYFLTIVLPFLTKRKAWQLVFYAACFVMAAYVTIRMETRSGLLVLLGALCCSFMVSGDGRFGKEKIRLILLSCVAVIVLVFYSSFWFDEVSEVVSRRFDSYNMGTAFGRLHSIMFLPYNILNLDYWLPKGTDAYVKEAGSLPHSSPTHIFLLGGILGIIGWFGLFIAPLFKCVLYFYSKKLEQPQKAALLIGLCSFVVSVTLPAGLFEQAWLWAGAVAGVSVSKDKQI